MIQDNLIIQLLSQGLSWRDSLSAKEQARLLNNGETALWRKGVIASADSLGIPKTLRQMAFSFREVRAWGVYIDAVLNLFGISELQGLACNPAEFVERVAAKEPGSWEDVKQMAITIAGEYLEQQLETGDVYLLHPSELTSPEFSRYVPSIIDARKSRLEQSQPYLRDDGLVDLFDFLELPITMELMLESGVGGRAPLDKAKVVLERMSDLELTSETEPTEKRKIKRSVEEQYLTLYQNCMTNHTELLRGAAMSYDPDERICKRGISLIHASGHAHTMQPLVFGLEKQDDEIVELSLRGLGVLGNPQVIDKVGGILNGNPTEEIQIAACVTLGQLRGEKYLDKIANLVPSRNDAVGLAAMQALLSINSSDSMDIFWQQIPRFGIPKLANISNAIADTNTDDAIIFMIGLMLLDLQAFLYTREVHFYNAFLQIKDDVQKTILISLVKMFRGHAVNGFGRIGDRAVPVLVSILNIFPETQHLFQDKTIWEQSENQLKQKVSSRLQQYFRFPRAESVPTPVVETIRALGVTHSVRAIPFLEEICQMGNEELTSHAMEALSEIDIPAIDAILNVDDESSMKLKFQKVHDLGTIVHPKVTKWLIEQLDDNNPLLRMQAANFLAMRNDPSLAKPLMKAAKDSNKGVRAGLANVMIRLGMDTYPDILNLLSEDKDEDIRKIITKAQLAFKADQDDDYWA